MLSARERLLRRAAFELQNGMTVNLGIGLPTALMQFVPPDIKVCVHSENGIAGMGGVAGQGSQNRNLIDAGGSYVTTLAGAAFLAAAAGLAAAFFTATGLATAFLATGFFATGLAATLATAFFATGFLATGLATTFLAGVFLAATAAAGFFATFAATVFFAGAGFAFTAGLVAAFLAAGLVVAITLLLESGFSKRKKLGRSR